MKKFLGFLMIAVAAFMTSCGITGLQNVPTCDDQAGTINGKAYDNETYKCWKVEWWQETYSTDEGSEKTSDTEYVWATSYQINKTWMNWKALANVSATAYGYTASSSGDYTLTEVQGRTDETCYDTYGE